MLPWMVSSLDCSEVIDFLRHFFRTTYLKICNAKIGNQCGFGAKTVRNDGPARSIWRVYERTSEKSPLGSLQVDFPLNPLWNSHCAADISRESTRSKTLARSRPWDLRSKIPWKLVLFMIFSKQKKIDRSANSFFEKVHRFCCAKLQILHGFSRWEISIVEFSVVGSQNNFKLFFCLDFYMK